MKKTNSPYSAAFTGGAFLFDETIALLPLLQSKDRKELMKDEKINNRILKINSESARSRVMAEVSRRYDTMTEQFWNDFNDMSYDDKYVANFFVILKTYKICFDFHVNVTLKKWNSITKAVTKDDVEMEMNELAAQDEFVDSWTESTKKKMASNYLTILRRVGMLDADNNLNALNASNFDYYINQGEEWFLDACLLMPFEIEKIKNNIL